MKQNKEPLLRIAKRDGISRGRAYAIRIISVLLSLVVSGVFIFAVTKLNPIDVYKELFNGAFGTARRSWVTIRDSMMLLCIGVGLAPAFKMKFWNIGAEGQILIDVRLDGHIVTGVGHVEQRVFIAPLRQWAAIQPDQIFAARADSPCGKIVEHSAIDISASVDLRGPEYYRYRA